MHPIERELIDIFPPKPFDVADFADSSHRWQRYPEASAFETGCIGQPWTDLPTAFVESHEEALRWLAPRAFVAILPACMMVLLRGDVEQPSLLARSVFMHLTRRNRWARQFDARVRLLNGQQRHLLVRIMEELMRRHRDFSPYEGNYYETLDSLRELPICDENSWPVVLPETTNLLPLPGRYADLQREIVAVFPAKPIVLDLFLDWKGPWSENPGNVAFEDASCGKTWEHLGPNFLFAHQSAPTILPSNAFVALIPAYLARLLHDHDEMEMLVYVLTRREGWEFEFDPHVAGRLDEAQKKVVLHVFEALARRPDLSEKYARRVELAVDTWRKIIDGTIKLSAKVSESQPSPFDVQELLQELRNAFPPKQLLPEIFADVVPNLAMNQEEVEEQKKFFDSCLGRTWASVSPAVLERAASDLGRMQYRAPLVFLALLPAYVEMLIYGDAETMWILNVLTRDTNSEGEFDAIVKLLEPSQHLVIRRVLESMAHPSHRQSNVYPDKIRAAIASWSDFPEPVK